MSSQIQIQKPCNENWNGMQPVEGGKHCTQCCKTVVDFDGWQAEQIKEHLLQNGGKKICGRVAANEVYVPKPKSAFRWTAIGKIAVTVLLYLGLASCSRRTLKGEDDKIVGELMPPPDATTDTTEIVLTPNNSYIMGMMETPPIFGKDSTPAALPDTLSQTK